MDHKIEFRGVCPKQQESQGSLKHKDIKRNQESELLCLEINIPNFYVPILSNDLCAQMWLTARTLPSQPKFMGMQSDPRGAQSYSFLVKMSKWQAYNI